MFGVTHARQFYALCCLMIIADKLLDIPWLSLALTGVLCLVALDLLRNGEEFSNKNKVSKVRSQEEDVVSITEEAVLVETSSSDVTVLRVEEVVTVAKPVSTAKHLAEAHEQEAHLETLKALYDEDRPFEAVQELQRLRASGLINEEAYFSKPNRAMISEVDEAQKEIFRLTDSLEKESNWKLRMTHKNCDIFASTVDSRDFKVVCVCPDSNMFNLLSLIIETQYYKHWVPGVCESGRWDLSMFFQNLYLRFKLPYPFKDREVLLKGYGDVWKGSKVMIYIASVDSKEAERNLNVRSGASRAEVIFSGILLRPLQHGTELTLISRLDLKLPFLPDVIFDYAAKFVLAELCVFLRDRSKTMSDNPDHPDNKMWIDRQTGNEARMYNEIRERLSKISTT